MESNKFEKQTTKFSDRIAREIDRSFSDEELLYRDVINAWPQQDTSTNRLKKIPHYKEHYEKTGRRDVEAVRKNFGEEEAMEHEEYYPIALDRIMQLSNPEQVAKYNDLVDEYNKDLERIKAEDDTQKLRHFLERMLLLIEEKK